MNRIITLIMFFYFAAASCATAPKPGVQEQETFAALYKERHQSTPAYAPAVQKPKTVYEQVIPEPWTGFMVVEPVGVEVAIVASDDADETTHEIPGGTRLKCRSGTWDGDSAVICDVHPFQNLFLKRVIFPTPRHSHDIKWRPVLVELDARQMLEGGFDCMLYLYPEPGTFSDYHAAGVRGYIYKASLQEIAFCIGRDCGQCVRPHNPTKAQ